MDQTYGRRKNDSEMARKRIELENPYIIILYFELIFITEFIYWNGLCDDFFNIVLYR